MNRLNTGDTGQAVTSSNDGLLYSGFIGDGQYVLSSGSEFEVEVQSNNLLRMADGSALMQGRHVEIPPSDSEYITINNGSQGMNRKDLVVFRYTKDVTGIESVNVVVIEGEETSGTAQAPDYTEGDILTGATLADMPMYEVELQGINIINVTPLFETIGTHKDASDKIAEHDQAISDLNSNLSIQTIASGTNLNSIQSNGIYICKGLTLSNSPTDSTWYYLRCYFDSSLGLQIIFDSNTNIFVRMATGSTLTWRAWKKITTTNVSN